jgi:hypothetical protein
MIILSRFLVRIGIRHGKGAIGLLGLQKQWQDEKDAVKIEIPER